MPRVFRYIYYRYRSWHDTLRFSDVIFEADKAGDIAERYQIVYRGERVKDAQKVELNRPISTLKKLFERQRVAYARGDIIPQIYKTYQELELIQIFELNTAKQQRDAYKNFLDSLIQFGFKGSKIQDENMRGPVLDEEDKTQAWLQYQGGMTAALHLESVGMRRFIVGTVALVGNKTSHIHGVGLVQLLRVMQCIIKISGSDEWQNSVYTYYDSFQISLQFMLYVKHRLTLISGIGALLIEREYVKYMIQQNEREVMQRRVDDNQNAERVQVDVLKQHIPAMDMYINTAYKSKDQSAIVSGVQQQGQQYQEYNLALDDQFHSQYLNQYQMTDEQAIQIQNQQGVIGLRDAMKERFRQLYQGMQEQCGIQIQIEEVMRKILSSESYEYEDRNKARYVQINMNMQVKCVKLAALANEIKTITENAAVQQAARAFNTTMNELLNGGVRGDERLVKYYTVVIELFRRIPQNANGAIDYKVLGQNVHDRFYEGFSDLLFKYGRDEDVLQDVENNRINYAQNGGIEMDGFQRRNDMVNIFDIISSQLVGIEARVRNMTDLISSSGARVKSTFQDISIVKEGISLRKNIETAEDDVEDEIQIASVQNVQEQLDGQGLIKKKKAQKQQKQTQTNVNKNTKTLFGAKVGEQRKMDKRDEEQDEEEKYDQGAYKQIKRKRIPNGTKERVLHALCLMYQISAPKPKDLKRETCFEDVLKELGRLARKGDDDACDVQIDEFMNIIVTKYQIVLDDLENPIRTYTKSDITDAHTVRRIDIIEMHNHVFIANKRVDYEYLNEFIAMSDIWQANGNMCKSYTSFLKDNQFADDESSVHAYITQNVLRTVKQPVFTRYTMQPQLATSQDESVLDSAVICNYDLETYERNDLQNRSIQKNGMCHYDYCVAFKLRCVGKTMSHEINEINALSPIISLVDQQVSQKFLELLIAFQNKTKATIHCYAYNGSKFDAHFIMRAARRSKIPIEVIGDGGCIKELRLLKGAIRFKDTKAVLGLFGSLARVSKNLKLTNQKDALDIALYVKKEEVEANIEAIAKYCQQDVNTDHELLEKVSSELIGIFQENGVSRVDAWNEFLRAISLSQLALAAFKNGGLDEQTTVTACSPERPEILIAQRESYRGGVTEAMFVGNKAFNINDQNEQVHCYDFNSLYPSIMQGIPFLLNMGRQNMCELARGKVLRSLHDYIDFGEANLNKQQYNGREIEQSILNVKRYDNIDGVQFPVLNFSPLIGDQDIYCLRRFKMNPIAQIGLIGVKIPDECTLYPIEYDVSEFNACYKQKSEGVWVLGFMLRNGFITDQLREVEFKKIVYTDTRSELVRQNAKGEKRIELLQNYLFQTHIRSIYSKRLEAKRQGQTARSEVYKLLMNSLYGKFSQRLNQSQRIMTKSEYSKDHALKRVLYDLIHRGGGLYKHNTMDLTEYTREYIDARVRQSLESGQVQIEFLESYEKDIDPLVRLGYFNETSQHSKIGGLVLIASTIAAIGQFLEVSLINISSGQNRFGAKAVCYYADTDSVFINHHAACLVNDNDSAAWVKGGHNLFKINDSNSMFALKRETERFIDEMYIFGRKFYAYRQGDKWTNKCKGIQACELRLFQEMFTEGSASTNQLRFVKRNGYVETHNRTIRNITKLKQQLNKGHVTESMCALKPFLSPLQYNDCYVGDSVCVRQGGVWRVGIPHTQDIRNFIQ